MNLAYFARRAAYYITIFFIAITVDFFLPRLAPGNPAEAVLAHIARAGGNVSPNQLNALELEMGLSHAPLYVQYGQYLLNLFRGHFGLSLSYYPTPVTYFVWNSLPWTLFLVITAVVISFFLGNKLGMYAALRRLKSADVLTSTLSMFVYGFPAFSLALILVTIFARDMGIFPELNAYSISFLGPTLSLPFIVSVLYHSVLPILTIILTSLAGWVIGMRNNFIPVLGEDFVNFYRIMGIPKKMIAKSAYRVAFLPNLTGFALALGFSVTGVLVIENIFSYPGIGTFLYQSVENLDYPMISAIFIIIVLAVLIANLVVEIIYGLIDPRVRQEAQ